MQSHNLLLVVIALSGLLPAALVRSLERCVTPNGDQGVCIGIRQCQPLLALLRRHGTSAANFLRSSLCPNDNPHHLVCCPKPFRQPFPSPDRVLANGNVLKRTTVAPQRSNKYWPIHEPACGVSNSRLARIINGIPATLGSWPWLAAVGYRSQMSPDKVDWKCGGSLISSRHVLTAAHCADKNHIPYVVRLGDLDLDETVKDGANPINVLVDQYHVHPQYNKFSHTNDIAILRLVRDVPFNDLIQPICLPLTDELRYKNFEGALPFVAGWGQISVGGPTSTHLQQVQLPIVDHQACKAAFVRLNLLQAVIDQRVICTGFPQGARIPADGGPLMYPKRTAGDNERVAFYAVGVVSYGFGCARPGNPAVYTRIAEFLSFIQSHLN